MDDFKTLLIASANTLFFAGCAYGWVSLTMEGGYFIGYVLLYGLAALLWLAGGLSRLAPVSMAAVSTLGGLWFAVPFVLTFPEGSIVNWFMPLYAVLVVFLLLSRYVTTLKFSWTVGIGCVHAALIAGIVTGGFTGIVACVAAGVLLTALAWTLGRGRAVRA